MRDVFILVISILVPLTFLPANPWAAIGASIGIILVCGRRYDMGAGLLTHLVLMSVTLNCVGVIIWSILVMLG